MIQVMIHDDVLPDIISVTCYLTHNNAYSQMVTCPFKKQQIFPVQSFLLDLDLFLLP